MSKLRPIHLAVVVAFVAGILVTLGIMVAIGGGDDKEAPPAVRSSTSTPPPTTAPAPTQVATVSPSPTSAPNLAQSALTVPTPLIPTPTASQRPGICNASAESAYMARAVPPLQQLSSSFKGWQNATISTQSAEMQALRQLLMPFTQAFEAITPLPEGCTFIHNRVLQAAKDLADTASRVDSNNVPALRGSWDTEYNGRTGAMKEALDVYLSVTSLTLNPRPFP